ncbi:gamma-glutamyl-gamma-aminobutyraldehyde dehydrogenase [Arthrobacter sp. V4I6]|uniref:aldehyde dehydrogenase n=1 Tax=unclassified Arthrobacter TaxID=235627 RepID=UPI002783AC80|nr:MULTISPECIES: aldehyde dehydrogenase [unclassified Arthrobacter]MDQ0822444.1 gamma-glutamyl-gamma-aminobutyraldehyde dehydrogenase [Arthrobacter sp. V1I7]MDQ0852070.1 gamma-glutamyl-gamma-aminobutyraldehyde dehydrogenase [Arthrobacter sp. V4I6]
MITNALDAHPAPTLPKVDGRAYIEGRTDGATGQTFASISPVDGRTVAEVAACTAEDVERAVKAARRSFESGEWSRSSTDHRKACLLNLAELIETNADELSLLETLDMGKPLAQSSSIDIPGTAATFRWYAELIDKISDEVPSTPPGSTALVTREALGVVVAITPWNYPLEIAAWKLAPALAMGNSVVLKPATQSSLTALRLADLAAEAGLPAGVLNVVTGSGAIVGEALARHNDVDALTFTGSTAVAKHLQICAGESNMKRLTLEAGGKSSNLIFADADLPTAAQKAAFGAFYNQGEVCSANSRILVERPVYKEFIELLARASKDYTPGNPLDPQHQGSGALVDTKHADSVMQAIEEASQAGTIYAGGSRLTIEGSDSYIEPTIVTDLPADHHLHRTEVFGPVVTVTPFDAEDEAVALANNTEYGLAASLWTSDFGRAHRVAARLVAGTVSVNTVDALGLTTPFGGFRQSGFGRDLSAHALDNYSALKTTWFQHG